MEAIRFLLAFRLLMACRRGDNTQLMLDRFFDFSIVSFHLFLSYSYVSCHYYAHSTVKIMRKDQYL